MDQHARDAYLEAQVLTAPPQKLRLMLIDGAIRFARQALRHWEQQQLELAVEALVRCRAIVAELLASIDIEASPLTRRVAALYAFLYRQLTTAHAEHDRRRVEEVIEVLTVDRETWWLLCERLPTPDAALGRGALVETPEIIAPRVAFPDAAAPGGNVSLDA